MGYRIHLSPPDVGEAERELLLDAFDSNWIAPLGPHVDALEHELAELAGRRNAVALQSGTAALHLALLLSGVGPGDRVLTSTLTFAATANAIAYVGAEPVFIDVDPATWQLDPELVDRELRSSTEAARPPAAIVTVDLYGQCADHDAVEASAREHGAIPVVEDAAEGLGATWCGRPAGAFGDLALFSFNGNKIVTGSSGGALVTDDAEVAERARYLATQARQPAPHYQHTEVGFSYRLSNLLAAVVRGQLRGLDGKVARRRAIAARYRGALADVPGVAFMPVDPRGQPNAWLTVLTIDPQATPSGADREAVRHHLDAQGIEARPVWKPMHRQPVFASAEARLTGVADRLFDLGLCLPSGSSLTDDEVDEVAAEVRRRLT